MLDLVRPQGGHLEAALAPAFCRGVFDGPGYVVTDNISDGFKEYCTYIDFFQTFTAMADSWQWPMGFKGFFDNGVDHDAGVLLKELQDCEDAVTRGAVDTSGSQLDRALNFPQKWRRAPLALPPPPSLLALGDGSQARQVAGDSSSASSSSTGPSALPMP